MSLLATKGTNQVHTSQESAKIGGSKASWAMEVAGVQKGLEEKRERDSLQDWRDFVITCPIPPLLSSSRPTCPRNSRWTVLLQSCRLKISQHCPHRIPDYRPRQINLSGRGEPCLCLDHPLITQLILSNSPQENPKRSSLFQLPVCSCRVNPLKPSLPQGQHRQLV